MAANFYEQVYAVVRRIPPGKVTSYGRVAQMLGRPRAARAVGYALSALKDVEPSQRDVPWQRVINSQGRVSIRNLRHAMAEQQALLEAEGVEFDARGYVDWRRFGWDGLSSVELEALLEQIADS